MGVTIRCKKTGHSIDIGSGGFLCLRRKISDLVGDPWAAHYRHLTDSSPVDRPEDWYKKFNQITQSLIETRRVSVKIVDFLLQSDCSGAIRYGACKQLLKVIGDYDDNILYGYAGRPDCAMFKDFKRLLEECAENKCDLEWS